MSDARNSSNSLRGGGAKQTGGAGRTNKYAAHTTNNKTAELLGGSGGPGGARAAAKQKLQLLVASKHVAQEIRTALLLEQTEAEYQTYDVPLPNTEAAKAKLQAMQDFTEHWYDQDFRDEWLQTVTAVWLAELKAQYHAAVQAATAKAQGSGGSANAEEGEAVSIEELTDQIANLDPLTTSSEERQRLKKKLKRKKQRAREKDKKSSAEPSPQEQQK